MTDYGEAPPLGGNSSSPARGGASNSVNNLNSRQPPGFGSCFQSINNPINNQNGKISDTSWQNDKNPQSSANNYPQQQNSEIYQNNNSSRNFTTSPPSKFENFDQKFNYNNSNCPPPSKNCSSINNNLTSTEENHHQNTNKSMTQQQFSSPGYKSPEYNSPGYTSPGYTSPGYGSPSGPWYILAGTQFDAQCLKIDKNHKVGLH